jgi:probable H4MPT-linked C1 transfer pathway protein
MNSQIIGWDVGGAHLKAALLGPDGALQQVLQVPCPLWRGLHELELAIDIVLNAFKVSSALHAVTMTGELVDLFANRREGVLAISRVMQTKLNCAPNLNCLKFYTGVLNPALNSNLNPNLVRPLSATGFVSFDEVEDYWPFIASANWQASASFVAQKIECGLFVDIGSTTTDFVLLENNKPACIGFTDAARMQTDELVYTGVVRTPLMAVAQRIEFQQAMTSVAAEFFATSADVYRLTGDLSAEDDMADTADAQDKGQLTSARRIARMIGHDVEDAPIMDWHSLAEQFKWQQILRLQTVATKHISRLSNENKKQSMVLIGSGAGGFLVAAIAKNLAIPYIDVADLIILNKENAESQISSVDDSAIAIRRRASVCLPAYALAYLAQQFLEN